MRTKLAVTLAMVTALVGVAGSADAQVINGTTYPFTVGAGVALENMASGTTQLIGPSVDDTGSAVTNIGFDYWHNGVRAAQFSVNPNGNLKLGSVVIGTSFSNSIATTTDAPKVPPYWDDLCTGSTGKVHYKVVGTAPTRKLVVEWFNMEARNGACNDVGNETFQAWLFESTGVIEFVYGAIPAAPAGDGGYSIGTQAGLATNFASVTTLGATVSYTVANNTQLDAIPAGTAYLFTPPVPADPTALAFSGTTQFATTLNWADNSSNEIGFVIYKSTDGGTTYSFLTQTAANAVTFTDSTLGPGQTYFYKVYAVTEGALSANAASGSVTTNPAGNVTSTAAGGNWSSVLTWVGGTIPGPGDAVLIVDGATVTIDTAAVAWSVQVGQGTSGILQYDPTTARTLTVGSNVTVTANGLFQSATTGTVTTHSLSLPGNLTVNGVLDFSTNANTAGAGITFTGTTNSTVSGSGSVDVRTITENKGTTNAAILELMPATFTVQDVNTDSAGFLTLTAGTFKISGTFTGTNRVFPAAAWTIPAAAGFWLNNPNYVVAGQNANGINAGLFRLTQGTFNQGTTNLNGFTASTGAVFTIEGGTLNVAARFAPGVAITYNQSAGTVNVATVGNATASAGSFDLVTTTSTLNMTGGTIVLVQANTSATPLDFRNSVTQLPAGTILQVGSAATATNFTFRVSGTLPNLVIDTSGGNAKSVTLFAATTMRLGNLSIPAGSTFTLNGFVLSIFTNISNAGVINGVTVNSRINFLGAAAQTYSGTGTAGTAASPLAGFGVANLAGLTVQSPMVTLRVNLFSGPINGAGQITLGAGGASTAVVQVSQAGSTVLGGRFITPPVFNLGTGGQINLYLQQPGQHTTGNELNPTRTLFQMQVDSTFGLAVTGGDLTVNGNIAGAITMTNGRIVTGANALYFSDATSGTVVRTNGIVDGNFKKRWFGTGAKTFEVGTANGYSPVDITLTAGTFPADFTVKAVEGPAPNIQPVGQALARYWQLTATGVTANLVFHYIDPIDIPPTATEANFHIYRHDAVFTDLGGTIDTTLDTASITGITQFSDWTLAEPGATPVDLSNFKVE